MGMVATNTIGQGDTRSTGLRWICTHGGTVYAATGIAPKLLRIRGAKVETAFTSPDKGDIEVLSVAVGRDVVVPGGTKIIDALAPVCRTASRTVLLQ